MLNIGFIACGGIARHHASRLANVRGARIIACADTSAESAESFAAEFGEPGASTYTDYRRMLRRADLVGRLYDENCPDRLEFLH